MENEVKVNHSRFRGAEWYESAQNTPPVLIGGAGGLGSWLALFLARIGLPAIGIYDDDTVEKVNMSGQFFQETQVSLPKVQAVADNVKLFTGENIVTFEQKFDGSSMRADYMFSMFDNMEARKIFFQKWLLKDTRKVFIDARLDFEQIDIFCVTKESEKEYFEDYLFEDSEVEDNDCTLKQTTHVAALAAAWAVGAFTNYLSPHRKPEFYQKYIIPANLLL